MNSKANNSKRKVIVVDMSRSTRIKMDNWENHGATRLNLQEPETKRTLRPRMSQGSNKSASVFSGLSELENEESMGSKSKERKRVDSKPKIKTEIRNPIDSGPMSYQHRSRNPMTMNIEENRSRPSSLESHSGKQRMIGSIRLKDLVEMETMQFEEEDLRRSRNLAKNNLKEDSKTRKSKERNSGLRSSSRRSSLVLEENEKNSSIKSKVILKKEKSEVDRPAVVLEKRESLRRSRPSFFNLNPEWESYDPAHWRNQSTEYRNIKIKRKTSNSKRERSIVISKKNKRENSSSIGILDFHESFCDICFSSLSIFLFFFNQESYISHKALDIHCQFEGCLSCL